MKVIKKGLVIGAALFCMPMLTACSFKETLSILWNSEDKSEDTGEKKEVKLDASKIDPNVEVPTINTVMGDPVTYDLHAVAEPLTIEAVVADGGTLTYQWYRNNVDSNGGGTLIEGATENTFTPPTEESGTSYYYAVVTNTVNEGIQLATSGTKCVTITEVEAVPVEEAAPPVFTTADGIQGNFIADGVGKKFQYADGNFAVSKWEIINNERYLFDENGYARIGWYQEGENAFYFDANGIMQHDTEVDGYVLGSDGLRQAPVAPAQEAPPAPAQEAPPAPAQ